MEINYLKEFIVLAETENFIEASESLFISQSSLSKHIKSLENEIGFPLFKRTTRKVQLNEYGKILLEYSKQIANLEYEYMTALINQSKNTKHSINIGSIPIMAPYHITDAIMKFKVENKNISVNLIEDDSSKLKDLLRQNKCDLAFIRDENENDDEFVKIPYTTDTLVAILPSYHPLAKEKELNLLQLRYEDFLLLQPGSLLYNLCRNVCQEAGFSPNITYTGQRAENIIDLIEKGMGVSLLMKMPIKYLSTPKISIIDIKPEISTQIKIYYKKDTKLSTPAKHFIDSIHLLM
ncbi:MAG: LysR family transcriptional regulator [Turicibacter sp.]|nr:LysR family transcriptional regulator [Turicibacter sp.]